MCNGQEYREYKRDKARRCSRLVRPLEQFSKRMVPLVETRRVQGLLY
jgi:hypothetical protein